MALGHRSKDSSKSHSKLEFFNFASGNWTIVSNKKLICLNSVLFQATTYPYHSTIINVPIIYHKSSYYVFGGKAQYSGDSYAYDDIARFDEQRTWKRLEPGKLIKARYGHEVVMFGDSFMIIGGNGSQYNQKCDYADWGDVITCERQGSTISDYKNYPQIHFVPQNYCKAT